MLKLIKFKPKKQALMQTEMGMSSFLPYVYMYNENTTMIQKECLMKTVQLDGYSFETADDEDIDVRKAIRNQLMRSMSSGSVGLYFHLLRRRQSIFSRDFGNVRCGIYFADFVQDVWRNKLFSSQNFVNELYVTVVRKTNKTGLAIIEYTLQKMRSATSKVQWENALRDAHEELEEMINRICSSFRDYTPKILGIKYTKHGIFSETYEFYSKLLNGGSGHPVLLIPGNIAKFLGKVRIYFGHRSIEIISVAGKKYAAIVSLKEYGQSTSAGMLDKFLQLPYELLITQSYQFTNRQTAISKMQIQQNRMIQSNDKAVSQVHEISSALDDAMSGRISFGEHHLTILCLERTPKMLEHTVSMVDVELTNTGVYTSREKTNMEPAFWAQMPGNFDFIVRKAVISTLNIAGFASNHNYPIGLPTGNHWGEAVTVFNTTSSTPFFFSFHVRDVGHTTIIGPTGAGKTVLMNFLCAQSLKFKPRLFFFDKDRGAEIFLRAVGGIYTIIEPRTKSGFNPMQLDDTAENRTFLMTWIRLLVTTTESNISSADVEILSGAITGNYKLQKKDRVLSNLAPFLGLDGPGTLNGRLSMWFGRGSHAALFDNPIDEIDFSKSSIFGFEMGRLLQDSAALGPVLSYLFHRISSSLDGAPTMIILDEAWALIDNPVFAPTIKDWLKVLRKLNTFVVFATQSVEDVGKSAISDTLIQQTATQIFLPNLKATDIYRKTFMLSKREFALIKHTDPSSRFFLVKQGVKAVIARIDLKGMDDVVNVLSGRAETVRLLDSIRQEVGEDPRIWLPIFYKKVKDV